MAKQITFRVRDRDAVQRRLAELSLEYDAIWDAEVWQIHTAIVEFALDNPDMLVRRLEEMQRE